MVGSDSDGGNSRAQRRTVGRRVDDVNRRLVYTVVDGPLGAKHHQASVEVHADPADPAHSRVVWVTDVAPLVEMTRPDIAKARDLLPYRTVSLRGNPLSATAKNTELPELRKAVGTVTADN